MSHKKKIDLYLKKLAKTATDKKQLRYFINQSLQYSNWWYYGKNPEYRFQFKNNPIYEFRWKLIGKQPQDRATFDELAIYSKRRYMVDKLLNIKFDASYGFLYFDKPLEELEPEDIKFYNHKECPN